jgi:hypothetical protein
MRSHFRVFVTVILLIGSFLFLPGRNKPQNNSDVARAASDPVIAAAGDIACDPASPTFNGGNGSVTSCRQKYTSDLLLNAGLAAVLPLGDIQYHCGGYQAFLQSYDLSWGRVKDITRPVVGNHEYLTSGGTDCTIANEGATGYFNYFGAAAGNPGQGYYSYNIGDWHLIALNSNCMDVGGCGPTSPQGKWLIADLAANPKWCTLAYWHIPLFSSGGRAEINSRDFWQILYDRDVDLILGGHDHIYERFAPQTPDGIADPVRGIRSFIVGSGGANHTSLATIAANSEVRNTDTFGVLKLTLRLSGYDWKFVPEAGKSFSDSGTQECHGSGTPPVPTTPTPKPTPTIAHANRCQSSCDHRRNESADQWIFNGQSQRLSFPNVNAGPVNMTSTNNVLSFGSQRGSTRSTTRQPASPNSWHCQTINSVKPTGRVVQQQEPDTQLRFGNVSNSTASVRVHR